jgi:hypothetical protein
MLDYPYLYLAGPRRAAPGQDGAYPANRAGTPDQGRGACLIGTKQAPLHQPLVVRGYRQTANLPSHTNSY